MDRFGVNLLTPREHEVVDLVLRGHNSESVARQLEIARDTVKFHRKRADAKLRVRSQGELFYMFLESLGLPRSEECPRGSLRCGAGFPRALGHRRPNPTQPQGILFVAGTLINDNYFCRPTTTRTAGLPL